MKAGYCCMIFGETVFRFSRCCRSENVPVLDGVPTNNSPSSVP
jgi:hypothetical protein